MEGPKIAFNKSSTIWLCGSHKKIRINLKHWTLMYLTIYRVLWGVTKRKRAVSGMLIELYGWSTYTQVWRKAVYKSGRKVFVWFTNNYTPNLTEMMINEAHCKFEMQGFSHLPLGLRHNSFASYWAVPLSPAPSLAEWPRRISGWRSLPLARHWKSLPACIYAQLQPETPASSTTKTLWFYSLLHAHSHTLEDSSRHSLEQLEVLWRQDVTHAGVKNVPLLNPCCGYWRPPSVCTVTSWHCEPVAPVHTPKTQSYSRKGIHTCMSRERASF